ncbi:hypothetical protein IIA16_00220 [bacterium]|nr:hypothetical protein [bacterium]
MKVFRLSANQVEILDLETGMRRAVLGSTQDGSVVLSFMAKPFGYNTLLELGLTSDDTPFITIFDKDGELIAELSVEYGEKTSLTIQIDGKAELLEASPSESEPPPESDHGPPTADNP